jgi:hypothetical protein
LQCNAEYQEYNWYGSGGDSSQLIVVQDAFDYKPSKKDKCANHNAPVEYVCDSPFKDGIEAHFA